MVQTRRRRLSTRTNIPDAYLDEVQRVFPFEVTIRNFTVGPNAIKNPMTGRTVDLRDDRRRRHFMKQVLMRTAQAEAEYEGINGYKFKRTFHEEDNTLSIYKLPLKYHIPISRASLDLHQFLQDFVRENNIGDNDLLRLSAIRADNEQHVSESYKTVEELLEMNRVLFTGDGSVQYETYSRLSMFQINVLHAPGPSGGQFTESDTLPQWIAERSGPKSKSIKLVYNDDLLCGQRCLVYHLATPLVRKKLIQSPARWSKEAYALTAQLGIGVDVTMKRQHFEHFCNAHNDWGVVIFDGLESVCLSLHNHRANIAYLIWQPTEDNVGHYHVCIDPSRLQNNHDFCPLCLKLLPRQFIATHTCKPLPFQCYHCNMRFVDKASLDAHKATTPLTVCATCNTEAYGVECQRRHRCRLHKRRCDSCSQLYDTRKPHTCFTSLCKICNQYVPENHRCYVQTLELSERKEPTLYVYDFESDVVTYDHHHAISVAWLRVGDTIDNIQYIHGLDTVQRFAAIVCSHKSSVWVAHNSRGYDFHLLRPALEAMSGITLDVVRNGQKIMLARIPRYKICFYDSLNHIADRLCNLPKTFGFDVQLKANGDIVCGKRVFRSTDDVSCLHELCDQLLLPRSDEYIAVYAQLQNADNLTKGHFPYRFPYSPGYCGEIPDVDMWGMENRGAQEYGQFEQWYDARLSTPYDYLKELEQYCKADVVILARAMHAYQKFGHSLTGIYPMTQCPTLAGFCQKTFRVHDLEDNQLAVLDNEQETFIREALFGGRTDITNCLVELTDAELLDGWEIKVADVVSLYPSVQIDKAMPVGHPWWQLSEFGPDLNAWVMRPTEYEGFLQIDINVCKSDIYPVLPTRQNGRVNWTCNNIRSGIYCWAEVRKAVRSGCNVVRIHKALLFRSSKSVWASYIKRFYKIKTMRGKKPKEVEAFCAELYERFGIELQPSDFDENPGAKQVAKNCLNNLWGKFGQRNFATDKICNKAQYQELAERCRNHEIKIKADECLGKNKFFVTYQDYKDDTVGTKRNVAVAAYVTCYGRLALLDGMRACGHQLCGHDTDSVFYKYHPTHGPFIKTGNLLGDWEPEYEDRRIYNFVGTGAKSYSEEGLPRDAPPGDYPQAMQCKLQHFERWCYSPACQLDNGGRKATINPVYEKLNEDTVGTWKVLGEVTGFRDTILQRIIDYVQWEPMLTVKAKGVMLSYNINEQKMNYANYRGLVTRPGATIEGLQDAPLKRVKIDSVTTHIRNNDGATKSVRFTADKRMPVKAEFAHLYTAGFRLPRGHEHCVV